MSAIPILLADAITAVINTAQAAAEFGTLSFTARRSYPDWEDDFKDLDSLAVDVVFVSSGTSGGDLVELDTVGTLGTELSIDIAIRKRFAAIDRELPGSATGRIKNSSIDPLVKFVEQIHVLFAEDRAVSISLATGVTANWLNATVRTYCDYKKLREGCFLGLVRVRFDVSKAVS